MSKEPRHRNWQFTCNFQKDREIQSWVGYDEDYMIEMEFQYEMASRLHQQGWFRLHEAKTLKWLKKHIHLTAHFEPAKSIKALRKYCSKPETRVDVKDNLGWPKAGHYGEEQVGQGKRTDLEDYKKLIDEGAKEEDLADKAFGTWAKYPNVYRRYIALKNKNKPKPKPEVILIQGKSGKGKTKLAVEIATKKYPGDYFIKTGNCKWWDNYDDESCIIMDDFEGQMEEKELLQFLDRYQFQGEIKGGMIFIKPKMIIITCETDTWYQQDNIKRRIDKIINL